MLSSNAFNYQPNKIYEKESYMRKSCEKSEEKRKKVTESEQTSQLITEVSLQEKHYFFHRKKQTKRKQASETTSPVCGKVTVLT